MRRSWRWVQASGLRPGGWWDGDPWRDPTDAGRHLRPREVRLLVMAAWGRRTREAPCATCGGVVLEELEPAPSWPSDRMALARSRCIRPPRSGGCAWKSDIWEATPDGSKDPLSSTLNW